ESAQSAAARLQSPVHMVETKEDFIAFDLHAPINRPPALNFLAVSDAAGEARQPRADRLLPGRMDVVLVARVGDDRQADPWQNFCGDQLRFAKFGPTAVAGRGGEFLDGPLFVPVPGRVLDGEKGEITLDPGLTPIADTF